MANLAMQYGTGRNPLSLRNVLLADAITCLAMASLLGALSTTLAPLLGLPAALLFWAGMALVPCAALMAGAAAKRIAAWVWLVIVGNLAWIIASVGVLFMFDGKTPAGTAFVAFQAAAVAVLAWLEFRGLK
jgi:hypothetical protein